MKTPKNEPILTYKRGSNERIALDKKLHEMADQTAHIPLCIGSEKIYNNLEKEQIMVSSFYSLKLVIVIFELGVNRR